MTEKKPLNELYRALNKNLLVRVTDQKKLNNGINVKEIRGRRDIIIGTVELAEEKLKLPQKCLCWFPLYAGVPITIEGKSYLIVPYDDLVMIEKVV